MRRRRIVRDLMLRKSHSLLALFALAVALVAAGALLLSARSAHPAPDIELTLLHGASTPLRSLRGRPVLINFWATTCRICVAELPQLAALYRELHPQGLEMVGIAMPYDPPILVHDFVRRRDVPFLIALDVQGVAARAFDGVRFTPTTFLLDAHGNIVFSQIGRLDTARVRRIIMRHLENDTRNG